MKKDVNQELRESFLRIFNNAKKMYEAEIKQTKACLTGTNGRLTVKVFIN